MAPLHSASEEASSDRALLLSLADLKQLLDTDGRLVVVLRDVESYAEADGYLQDLVKGARSVQLQEDPRVMSD